MQIFVCLSDKMAIFCEVSLVTNKNANFLAALALKMADFAKDEHKCKFLSALATKWLFFCANFLSYSTSLSNIICAPTVLRPSS
jgi:hypothetical protein